jgi:hypothetical protein
MLCTPYVPVVQHALRNEKPPVVYDETTPRTHDLSIDCAICAPTTINKTPDFRYKKEATRPYTAFLGRDDRLTELDRSQSQYGELAARG